MSIEIKVKNIKKDIVKKMFISVSTIIIYTSIFYSRHSYDSLIISIENYLFGNRLVYWKIL